MEILEPRIAPATLLALDDRNHLLRFSDRAADAAVSVTIAGLGAGETLVGIDVRAADGLLYGLTIDSAHAGRLYKIAPASGGATRAASLAADPSDSTSPFTALEGASFSINFDPVADRLRILSDTGQNLSVNTANGAVFTDTILARQVAVAASYSQSYPGATSTALYAIDAATDQLLLSATPNTGALAAVGALGVDATVAGFDIGHGVREAFAALTVAGTTGIYRIDLATGAATNLGKIGTGDIAVRALAVVQHTWTGAGADNLWTTPENWAAGLAPVPRDSVIFPEGAARLTTVNPEFVINAWNTLRFTGAGYTLSHPNTHFDEHERYEQILCDQIAGTNFLDDVSMTGLASPSVAALVEILHAGATLRINYLSVSDHADIAGAGDLSVRYLFGGFQVKGAIVHANGVLGGTVRVESGTLEVIGGPYPSDSGSPAGLVLAGGVVFGDGKVSNLTATGGELIENATALAVTSTYFPPVNTFALNSATMFTVNVPGAGQSLKPIAVDGSVALGGAALRLTSADGVLPGKLLLLRNDGIDPIIGQFAGVSEGGPVTLVGRAYTLSYKGGDGNDVEITAIGPSPLISANGRSANYTDADGDRVTVSVDRGKLTAGNFVLRDLGAGRAQLELLQFKDAKFTGVNVSVTAKRQGTHGNAMVNVGRIDATGVDLGAVTIVGDLAAIDCGDSDPRRPALYSLQANSLGVLGQSTGSPDLHSDIGGPAGRISIRGDLREATISFPSDNGAGPYANLGSLAIGGSLIGGSADDSGAITVGVRIGSISIGGSIFGGSGANSGEVVAMRTGNVSIGGSIFGGRGKFSGSMIAESSGSVTVRGSIIGGDGDGGGSFVTGATGAVFLGGNIEGGGGDGSGNFTPGHSASSFLMRGSVVGGSGVKSGYLDVATSRLLTVQGSIIGGAGDYSGSLDARSRAGIFIGGSIFGGAGASSGNVRLGKTAPRLEIGGSVLGGSGANTGVIKMETVNLLALRGFLIAGTGDHSGAIAATGQIGALFISGSVIGTAAHHATISAPGVASKSGGAVAFHTIAIGGSVSHADILAGYDFDYLSGVSPSRNDAQLDALSVVGNWIASNAIAGTTSGADHLFGTADDAVILLPGPGTIASRIGSVRIGSVVSGTATAGDHFGFVAGQIARLQVGSGPVLGPIASNAPIALGASGDVTARAIA